MRTSVRSSRLAQPSPDTQMRRDRVSIRRCCAGGVASIRAATLKKDSSHSKSGTTRRNGDAHPVLARLPDVSGEPPVKPRSARVAAAGFVDYRFDMPAGAQVSAEPSAAADASRGHQRTQPHAFKRSPRSDYRPRSFGSGSRLLPDSNPFAIPSASMADRLAPFARFLVMFILFTAAGTFFMSGQRDGAPREPSRPRSGSASSPAPTKQTLEPAPAMDHPSMATPTSFGPLGANTSSANRVEVTKLETDPVTLLEASPTPLLVGANGDPLPRVQTTEPQPIVREVSGNFFPANDAARPPAVARLPGVIFESPRTIK
jgi:hypothetical protein